MQSHAKRVLICAVVQLFVCASIGVFRLTVYDVSLVCAVADALFFSSLVWLFAWSFTLAKKTGSLAGVGYILKSFACLCTFRQRQSYGEYLRQTTQKKIGAGFNFLSFALVNVVLAVLFSALAV